MRPIREEYPELAEFLGAYFNQDFFLDYDSYDAAVDEFVSESTANDWPAVVLGEIDRLLQLQLGDADLRAYVIDAVMGITPAEATTDFLRLIRDRIAASI